MEMPLNGFDKIAWFYDPLSRLVFGNRLIGAQTAFMHHIRAGSRVLILGGGTGEVVKELLRRQPDCDITFVDASQAMLRRARLRFSHPSSITFIHGTEASIPSVHLFDVVITPFYLDMFMGDQLRTVIRQISSHLTAPALWIAADFCSKKTRWQRLQLAVMYGFFRVTTGISAKTLPDWDKILKEDGWVKLESLQFDEFIEGAIYTHKA